MSALPKRYFTQEEYLALELQADYKSQYVAGEIYAMAGAQPEHVALVTGIAALLYSQFRGRPCRVYSADLRVRVKPGELWTYPDVAAIRGKPRFDRSSDPASLLNPQVIFEVLSPSTEAFDRGDKFSRYQQLESLVDYVLVSADRVRVGHFTKQEGGAWTFKEYNSPDDTLVLASVKCELPLSEIYERVTFPDPAVP